jgi:hypothetical protein
MVLAVSVITFGPVASVTVLRHGGVAAGQRVGAVAGAVSGLVVLVLIESAAAATMGENYRLGPWIGRWASEVVALGALWGAFLGLAIKTASGLGPAVAAVSKL